METAGSSETLVTIYESVRCHVAEVFQSCLIQIFIEIFYYIVDRKNTEINNLRFCARSYNGFTRLMSVFSRTEHQGTLLLLLWLYSSLWPVTVAERSKARTVFARSETGIMGSNPTQNMDV
jgi:hypothetical protein